MRLKKVWIQEYKNLKDFTVEFDSSNFVDIFVGKNGSGKSNFFEALLEIFHHLKFFEKVLRFSYKVEFEQDSETYDYKFDSSTGILKLKDKKVSKIEARPLPDHVLIYYSGHNKQIPHFIDECEKKFDNKIKKMQEQVSPFFISLTDTYKKLFLTLTLFNNKTKDKDFLFEKLGLTGVDTALVVKLKRPDFADSRLKELGYDQIDLADAQTEFWGTTGIVQTFLKDLKSCIKGEYSPGDIYDRSNDSYTLPIDHKLYIARYNPEDIFSQVQYFDLLYRVGMLDNISLKITLKNGTVGNLEQFSDGQLQASYIYALTEIYSRKNSLILLDEPDTYLHPEWQYDFLKQFISIDTASPSHILLSSHSAISLCDFDDTMVGFMQIEDATNSVMYQKKSKKEVIASLSRNFIKYSEDEKSLLIDNVVRTSAKPIMFVEGITDVIILNTAYEKLYGENDIPILIQDAFDRGFIKILLSRGDLYDKYPGKTFYGLFDADDGYDDWRSLSGKISGSFDTGFNKKLNDKNSYAFLLPVRNELKSQVYDETNPIEKFLPKRCFGIEHVFWSDDEFNQKWFKLDSHTGHYKFKGDKYKVDFAKTIVPTLPKECFEPFRPMFEFIKSKINDTLNNATITP